MMLFIIILCVLSICVERSYKRGVDKGRCEVIEENLIRLSYRSPSEEPLNSY